MHQGASETLEREKLKRVNITDPESRLMQDSHRTIQPSYNGQIAVDEKEQALMLDTHLMRIWNIPSRRG